MQGTNGAAEAGANAAEKERAPRRRAGRPSAREAERKHEALLEAALEEFSRHGFHGASVRAIADRAGLSTRTLYNRYTDKVALFAACLQLSSLRNPWEPRPLGGSVHDALVDFARYMLARLNQDRQVQLARVIYRECTSFPELKAVSRRQFEHALLKPVQHILETHGFAPDQASTFSELYVAITFSRWQNRVIYDERAMTAPEIAEQVETSTAIFLNGVTALRNAS